MTIKEVINAVDGMLNNTVTRELKINFLSNLDKQIYNDVISTHEGGTQSFDGYDDKIDEDTELLVASPYDELYIYYLLAKINLMLQEIQFYNNNQAVYEETYGRYIAWYNRTHKPKGLNIMRV